MVLRPEAVRRRLARLEEVLTRLEELSYDSQDYRSGWPVERGLQIAAEILFDVGNHILSAHFGAAADDYEDILEKLARHQVIDSGLRQELAGLGGFRNILVHGYLDLAPDRVAEAHRRAPGLFGAYRRQVERWLELTLG